MGKSDKEDFEQMCNEIGGEHADRHGVSTQKCELDGKELHVKNSLSRAELRTRDKDSSSSRLSYKDSQAEAQIEGVRRVRLGHGEDNRRALVVDGATGEQHLKLVGGEQ